MPETLITIQSITELKKKLPPLVAEVIDITLLSKSYRKPISPIPKFRSTLYYVQSTVRAMHLTPHRQGVLSDELTYGVFRGIIEQIAKLAPTLMRHSIDKKGNEVMPPYEVYQNKNVVSDYYTFPMVAGNNANDFTVETFTADDECDDWQIGRKKLVNASKKYTSRLTDNDRYDPQPLIDTDWSKILTKRPVGRPRNPVDPFKGKKSPYNKRVTMKKLKKRIDLLDKKMDKLISLLEK